ncbi:MAG: lipopolysaccharide kinase InaA family protein [Planctomycetota bacterium]|jgi:tRNA A-37 threonylcarbamoyl transferase component Bud32
MSKFPFQLDIERVCGKQRQESLVCTAVLRVIPGRRAVYDAQWGQRSVIAKVFSDRISRRRHLKDEWRRLGLLRERGLSSPEPLFYGQTPDGRAVVVVEKIAESATVLEALEKTTDNDKRVDLLSKVCRELAGQHEKGVLQEDLHLGNFLVGGGEVFALDAGRMRFFSRRVGRMEGICQLALLVSSLQAPDNRLIERLCSEYMGVRGWDFEKQDELLFQRRLRFHKARGVRQGLKKSLRTSRRYVRIKDGEHVGVFDRSFCREAEALDFAARIDGLTEAGQILKDGGTCYVSRIAWNGKDVVVKRYNHKGFIHSLRHTIKGSRARRGWLHGHRLGMLNIATPRPLAFIEQRRGLLVWKSYLVTEYFEGRQLYDFLEDSDVSEQERSIVTEEVAKMFDKLAEHRVSFGDLKYSNILVTDDGPSVVDLDAVRVHKLDWLCRVRQARAIRRFESKRGIRHAVFGGAKFAGRG